MAATALSGEPGPALLTGHSLHGCGRTLSLPGISNPLISAQRPAISIETRHNHQAKKIIGKKKETAGTGQQTKLQSMKERKECG